LYFKIPVIADLAVGKNLQDHVITGLDMVTLQKSLRLTLKDIISPINIYRYFFKGTGKKNFVLFKFIKNQ